MSTDAFIPEGYEAPASGGGFTKLEDGNNTFRILSNPFMMWLSWTDGKPSRISYDQPKPAKGSGQKDSVKHAWGLIVWNYKTEQIEVFEIDKQDVINGLVAYAKNPKWGHPKKYDIVINKTGSGMDTSYTLTVEPHSEPSQAIIDGFIANPIDLTQLLVEGGNPYIQSGGGTPAPAEAAAQTAAAASAPVTGATTVPNGTVAEAFDAPEGEAAPKKKMPF